MGYHQHHRQMLADPYYIDTVARLRQARETAGLSQASIADIIGVKGRQVSCWERLAHLPSLHHYVEWCKALGFEAKEKE